MKTLRRLLFWVHLAAGVGAGVVILIMSLTGALLAFKPQVQRWVDRDVRSVRPPEGSARRVGVQEMLASVDQYKPGARPASIAMEGEPTASAAVAFGREGTVYVDPYTGRVLGEGSASLQASFRALEDWHRWLGGSADNRAFGKALTGASNLAFLFLAISGLYLWWPHKWLPQHVRAILMFRRQATGRARDFNWHNVIGFWCAPALIVLTASGSVISYPWASNLVYRLAGSPLPPAAGQTGQVGRVGQVGQVGQAGQVGQVGQVGQAGQVGQVGRVGQVGQAGRAETSGEAGRTPNVPADFDRLWARAEEQVPVWRSMTMRLPARGGGPVAFTITDATQWNAFARSQLTLDASTAEIVAWAPYEGTSLGQKARGWLRFAHTGELGGLAGQAVAGLASFGGVFLVWTGLALAWRRLLGWQFWKRASGERRRSAAEAA